MIETYLTLALLLVLMEIYLLPGLGLAPQPVVIRRQLRFRRALAGRLLAAPCYIPLLIDLRNPGIIPVILLCCLIVSPILIRGLRPTPSSSRELVFLAFVFAIPAFVTALVQPPAPVQSVFAGLVPGPSSSFPSLTLSKALALLLAYTLAIRPGTMLVRAMLSRLPEDRFPVLLHGPAGSGGAEIAAGSEEPSGNGLITAGKLIGNLERVIIVTLAFIGQYAAIGFVLTAKSIARFRFATRGWAEYYLLGTLASSACALLLGIALKTIWPLL